MKNYIRDNHLAGLMPKVCALCGKKFDAQPTYAYKERKTRNGIAKLRYYCSYKCFSKRDEETE